MKSASVEIKIICQEMKNNMPKYETNGSAGMDLRAAINNEITISPGKCVLVPSGIAIHIADKNIAGFIFPRSGLGHKLGLVLGNLVGVIDSDYQGEIKLSMWNRSNSNVTIKPLDRIAQLVFMPVIQTNFKIVEDFKLSSRGENGFGSTGT